MKGGGGGWQQPFSLLSFGEGHLVGFVPLKSLIFWKALERPCPSIKEPRPFKHMVHWCKFKHNPHLHHGDAGLNNGQCREGRRQAACSLKKNQQKRKKIEKKRPPTKKIYCIHTLPWPTESLRLSLPLATLPSPDASQSPKEKKKGRKGERGAGTCHCHPRKPRDRATFRARAFVPRL